MMNTALSESFRQRNIDSVSVMVVSGVLDVVCKPSPAEREESSFVNNVPPYSVVIVRMRNKPGQSVRG